MFNRKLCIWAIHVPKGIIVLLSSPQSGMKALHIIIALKNVTLVKNKKFIPIKMNDFAVTQFDNFCKNELIIVMFKLFDGKDASFVLFKPERNSNLSVQMLNYILLTMTEQFVFVFVNPISNLGNGLCNTLLAWSKALRNSPKLSSRNSISFLAILTSSLRINRCCNFESQKRNTLIAKKKFVRAFANSNYSVVGLWNVENVVIE